MSLCTADQPENSTVILLSYRDISTKELIRVSTDYGYEIFNQPGAFHWDEAVVIRNSIKTDIITGFLIAVNIQHNLEYIFASYKNFTSLNCTAIYWTRNRNSKESYKSEEVDHSISVAHVKHVYTSRHQMNNINFSLRHSTLSSRSPSPSRTTPTHACSHSVEAAGRQL